MFGVLPRGIASAGMNSTSNLLPALRSELALSSYIQKQETSDPVSNDLTHNYGTSQSLELGKIGSNRTCRLTLGSKRSRLVCTPLIRGQIVLVIRVRVLLCRSLGSGSVAAISADGAAAAIAAAAALRVLPAWRVAANAAARLRRSVYGAGCLVPLTAGAAALSLLGFLEETATHSVL